MAKVNIRADDTPQGTVVKIAGEIDVSEVDEQRQIPLYQRSSGARNCIIRILKQSAHHTFLDEALKFC